MDRIKTRLGNGLKANWLKLKICSPLGHGKSFHGCGLTSALVTRTSMQVSPPVPPCATSWALQTDKIRYTVSWSHSQARSKAGLDSVLIPEFAVYHDPFFDPFPTPFCALVQSVMDGALYVKFAFPFISSVSFLACHPYIFVQCFLTLVYPSLGCGLAHSYQVTNV